MARRPLAASFVLGSLALVAVQGLVGQGCTQDFSTFDPTGAGGGATTGPTSTSTSSSTGSPTTSPSSSDSSTSTSDTSTTGPGGGDGGGPTSTSGPGGGQGGAGGGPECVDASTCDDENPCTTDVCNGEGVCDHLPVADGPLGGTDDPNDCQNHDCVAGELVEGPDDTEDPADASPPCELTICAGGAPTPDFADGGTACGAPPLECDGAGVCVGCDPDGPDSQCGTPTDCAAPSCEADGSCNPNFEDAGTPVTDPTNGDCQTLECTGDSVNPGSVDDDTDTPTDATCGNGICNAGAPSQEVLAEGATCNGTPGVCDGLGSAAGNCKTCRDTVAGAGIDPGCSAGAPICDEATGTGVCRVCNDSAPDAGTDLGCPANQVCDPAGTGTCVVCYTDGGGDPVNCPGSEVCEAGGLGTCHTCYDLGAGGVDEGCDAVSPACDEANDTCEECQDAADCTGNLNGTSCSNGSGTLCGCTGPTDCTNSNQGHICRSGAGDDFCGCDAAADCTGITGVTGCSGAGGVCMCGANPCQ